MKFVLNKCYGGFDISDEAKKVYCSLMGIEEIVRFLEPTDETLITVVEKLGPKANGMCAKLKVVEIPDTCTDWEIRDYDGIQTVTYVVDGKLYHA